MRPPSVWSVRDRTSCRRTDGFTALGSGSEFHVRDFFAAALRQACMTPTMSEVVGMLAESNNTNRELAMFAKRVVCIRHGESAANAGAATDDPLLIPLTERGSQQAVQVAQTWEAKPSLIVVSPAVRARETAAPTIARFADVPVELWPIQEFAYLAPGRCAGATVSERRGWVDANWPKVDSEYQDGNGAESFAQFMDRVILTQERLSHLSSVVEATALVFGHGQLINALRWLRTGVRVRDMTTFRAFDADNLAQNGQVEALA